MSQASTKPTLAAGAIGRSGLSYGSGKGTVEIDLSEVEAMLGFIPPIVAATLVERNWDMIKHHRLGLIKDAATRFPGGRRAQKFVAAILHGYGRTSKGSPRTLEDASGEIFTASREAKALEEGGTIHAGEPMAILFRKPFARMQEIRKAIADRKFFVTARGEIVSKTFDQGARFNRTGQYTVLGVMRRVRNQKPLLNFYGRFDQNLPGHMAKLDKDLDRAMTDAGQRRLATRFEKGAAKRLAREVRLAEAIARKNTTRTPGTGGAGGGGAP